MADLHESRLALIPKLAESSPLGHLGRTALMKFLYFLQILRKVPLGYRFTLYSYGPFDYEVLADLSAAESLGAVESETILFSGGYGYEIRPGAKASWIQQRASDFLHQYASDIKWVIERFGSCGSSQLELLGTIVYVDRDAQKNKEKIELNNLVDKVHEVKPHFSKSQVLLAVGELAKDKLLSSIQ
jgi:hypothetical protein